MALLTDTLATPLVSAFHEINSMTVQMFLAGLKRDSEYAGSFRQPNIMPSPGDVLEAWLQGKISDELAANAVRQHGIYAIQLDPNADFGDANGHYLQLSTLWDAVIAAKKPVMTLAEAMDLFNRGQMSEFDLRWHMKRHGFKDKGYQNWLMNFTREIPGPGDLVHFVLRHGFEPSVIRANRLNEEFPESVRYWLGAQGLNYQFPIKDPFTGEIANTTWADMYWQTHWVPISPSQAYEAMQRLRPNRIARYQEIVPNVQPFTLADVNRWLRINDYPPGVRDTLAALSFRVLTRVDARRLYTSGVINKDELAETYQDMGYSPVDAGRLADFAEWQGKNAKKKVKTDLTRSKILSLYADGIIDDDTARLQLYRLEFQDEATLATYDALPLQRQVEIAKASKEVQHTWTYLMLELQHNRVKRFVSAYKKAYLAGRVNRNQIQARLAGLGIQPWKIDDLLQEWDLLLTEKRRQLSVSAIIDAFKRGLLQLNVAALRLQNLGYERDDIDVMLKKAQQEMAIADAKAAIAAGKKATAEQRALARKAAADEKAAAKGK